MISVIISIYNKQRFIGRCIESVLSQTYTDWELLLIDDGSTDASAERIQSYLADQRIRYIYKENGGVSSARNRGIKEAKGEWIIYIDADDYFLPEALQILYDTAVNNHVLISVGNFFLEKNDRRYTACYGHSRTVKDNFRSWYFMTCFPRAGAVLFHASVLKQHLFDEHLSRYEDAKSLFEIMRVYQLEYISKKVMVYSLDELGLSKPVSDVSKDYIFSMDVQGKSFWEKMILAQLFNQGLSLYVDKKQLLREKYKNLLLWAHIESVLHFFVRVRNKIYKLFI